MVVMRVSWMVGKLAEKKDMKLVEKWAAMKAEMKAEMKV